MSKKLSFVDQMELDIQKVKDYTKDKITPTAKEYLIKLLEAGKIAASTVATIVGTGINKIINSFC